MRVAAGDRPRASTFHPKQTWYITPCPPSTHVLTQSPSCYPCGAFQVACSAYLHALEVRSTCTLSPRAAYSLPQPRLDADKLTPLLPRNVAEWCGSQPGDPCPRRSTAWGGRSLLCLTSRRHVSAGEGVSSKEWSFQQ